MVRQTTFFEAELCGSWLDMFRLQLDHKFGMLPDSVEARTSGIDTEMELDVLSAQVLDADSFEAMGLFERHV